MNNNNVNDLIERAEKYREKLKNEYKENLVDEEFKKIVEKFVINVKNGNINRMFQVFNKKIKK